MKAENPFDKHMAINKGMPREVREAAVFVTDTLDVAWLAAQAVFEERASPEVALAIFDRFVSRIQAQASLSPVPHEQGVKSVENGRRTKRTP